jgi:putative PIN family toxin of toxin-antitoxin system
MRVVLDSNIYLSGLIFPGSKPAMILNLANKGTFEVFCSDFIVDEIGRILIKKFGYDERTTDQFIGTFLKFVKIIIPQNKVEIIETKKDDNRILECALSARADYLITGDKKHILPLRKIGKIKIINPAEFIEILKEKDEKVS